MEKNLQSEEALKKFKKLVEEINVCMFITNNQSEHNHTRPMATIEVDDQGTLWFYTDIRSIKVEEVVADRSVHLTYAHPGKERYMDVWGRAEVITNRQLIKDKWTPMVKAWFPNGPEDPNLALLKVIPTNCYYWESESGRMVQFFRRAASIVSEKPLANGAEGKLKM
jgi:general stress protein 26